MQSKMHERDHLHRNEVHKRDVATCFSKNLLLQPGSDEVHERSVTLIFFQDMTVLTTLSIHGKQ